MDNKTINERVKVHGVKSVIEDILLDFAGLYDEVTTSDLQGIASVEAKKIIDLIQTGKA